mgnify:CR=1 FL=1|jgi:hypothetical protein
MSEHDESYAISQARVYMQAAHDTDKDPATSAIIGGLNAVFLAQTELLKEVAALRQEINEMKAID